MQTDAERETEEALGDFASLLCQLDRPSDVVFVNGGYSELMARIAAPYDSRRIASGRRY